MIFPMNVIVVLTETLPTGEVLLSITGKCTATTRISHDTVLKRMPYGVEPYEAYITMLVRSKTSIPYRRWGKAFSGADDGGSYWSTSVAITAHIYGPKCRYFASCCWFGGAVSTILLVWALRFLPSKNVH